LPVNGTGATNSWLIELWTFRWWVDFSRLRCLDLLDWLDLLGSLLHGTECRIGLAERGRHRVKFRTGLFAYRVIFRTGLFAFQFALCLHLKQLICKHTIAIYES
jgi:hypothetical protein